MKIIKFPSKTCKCIKSLKFGFLIVILFVCNENQAQFSDLARFDYTILPKGNSNTEYSRFRGLFNYPIRLKKEGHYAFIGVDYSHINLKIDSQIAFDRNELDDFNLIDIPLSYTRPLKNEWRFAVRFIPGISSNLSARKLNLEDVTFSGDIVFIYDKTKDTNNKKPYRLIIGLTYSQNRGYDFPLPYINYYKKLSEKWSYNLGIPKSQFTYTYSEKHHLKLFGQLDGFTSNLQNGVQIDVPGEEPKLSRKINMRIIVGGLEYNYLLTPSLVFYARGAYILSNSVELRNSNRKSLFDLDNSNSSYINSGIRYKL